MHRCGGPPARVGGGSLQVWWVLAYLPKAFPAERRRLSSLLSHYCLSLVTIFPASWRERSGLRPGGMNHPPSPALLRTLLPSQSSCVTLPASTLGDGTCDPKLSAYSFTLTQSMLQTYCAKSFHLRKAQCAVFGLWDKSAFLSFIDQEKAGFRCPLAPQNAACWTPWGVCPTHDCWSQVPSQDQVAGSTCLTPPHHPPVPPHPPDIESSDSAWYRRGVSSSWSSCLPKLFFLSLLAPLKWKILPPCEVPLETMPCAPSLSWSVLRPCGSAWVSSPPWLPAQGMYCLCGRVVGSCYIRILEVAPHFSPEGSCPISLPSMAEKIPKTAVSSLAPLLPFPSLHIHRLSSHSKTLKMYPIATLPCCSPASAPFCTVMLFTSSFPWIIPARLSLLTSGITFGEEPT